MMIEWSALTAAFLLGLFSSAHCVGMCGGIMGALSMAIPAHAKSLRWMILLSYNLGRIISYSIMGVLVGVFAHQITESGGALWLRWLAGLLLIAMGLYLANWWRGLTYLEAGGRHLWAYLQPLGKALMPVDGVAKAIALGGLWGWLPCGLVYSALAYAMAQGSALGGGLIMLCFGLGTLPAVLATGFVAQQLGHVLRLNPVRWGAAVMIIVFGLWTIWGGGHNTHQHHHGNHSMTGETQSDTMEHHHHEHMGMDHSEVDHANMNHTQMNHTEMNHTEMNHTEMNHEGAIVTGAGVHGVDTSRANHSASTSAPNSEPASAKESVREQTDIRSASSVTSSLAGQH